MEKVFIHPTAEVEEGASIGPGTRIWHQAQVRTGAHVGSECNIGKSVYVDFGVTIGNRVKIQFHTVIGHGVTIEDGVMVGPNVSLCNDLFPRAITPAGQLQGNDDWEVGPVLIRYGASIGANVAIVPNVIVGSFAMVGAGSVVTRSIPDYALVYGNPARVHGYVCRCGRPLTEIVRTSSGVTGLCTFCNEEIALLGVDIPGLVQKTLGAV